MIKCSICRRGLQAKRGHDGILITPVLVEGAGDVLYPVKRFEQGAVLCKRCYRHFKHYMYRKGLEGFVIGLVRWRMKNGGAEE